jgi:hypothetical protein
VSLLEREAVGEKEAEQKRVLLKAKAFSDDYE